MGFESDKNKELFGKLCSSIETLFYVNRIAKLEAFKECYSSFSRLGELKRDKLSFEELQKRQTKLIKMMYEILEDAHFNPITFEMYKNSIEKIYLSDLPIKVDFAKLDSNLFTSFYAQCPELNPYKDLAQKPPFYQHFAVFYRGNGLNTMKGLFITQKFNLFIADIRAQFIGSNILKFLSFLDEDKNENLSNKQQKNKNNMVHSERVSLLDTYKAAKSEGVGSVIWWFLKNVTIKEPTFKRLLLIYRQVPESFVAEQRRKLLEKANKIKSKIKKTAKKKLGFKEEENKNKKEEMEQFVVDEIGRKRKKSLFELPDLSKNMDCDIFVHPIRIQYFSDIPQSDLEITYPAKQFSLKPLDQIYITFTIFIGIWAILKELLFSTDTMIGYLMVLTAIFLMIRSLFWYRATENEYVRVLNQSLVESNISTDQDTILSLIDSVDEQKFMETILAYFVLLRNEKENITDSQGVDRLCEQFMREEFGEDVNVMIDGAMMRLSELGLFKSGGTSKEDTIKVKELLDALSCAHQHYQSAIQCVRKIAVQSIDIKDNNNDNEQVETKQDDDNNKTPPIITAKDISDHHFNGTNDDDFTPID